MTELPFFQVDAFASAPFTGNPAAVMPLDAWLPDDVLQGIAAENNLAETAFLIPAPDDAEVDYELRWFTPGVEVALCGHATLASGHVILTTALAGAERVRFRTRKAGILEVARADEGYALTLPAWAASPQPLPDIFPDLVAAMGGAPGETLWREGGYAVFVYPDEDAVRALDPDYRALRKLGDILLIATAPGAATDIVSRAFAPGADIDEDPVTGSAHAVIAPYWAARLGRENFTAFQASARGGHLGCTLAGDRVILNGQCRTVIEGRWFV